jgi:hypothetical protein
MSELQAPWRINCERHRGNPAVRPLEPKQPVAYEPIGSSLRDLNRGHCDCATAGRSKKADTSAISPAATGESVPSLLKGITFSDEVLAWVSQALRESHIDESEFHDDAIARQA